MLGRSSRARLWVVAMLVAALGHGVALRAPAVEVAEHDARVGLASASDTLALRPSARAVLHPALLDAGPAILGAALRVFFAAPTALPVDESRRTLARVAPSVRGARAPPV